MATMTFERALQEIRSRISCKDFLQKSKHGQYCCPFCGSGNGPKGTGALNVYDDTNTWACFAETMADGGPRTGDVIDLYRQETGKDFVEAVNDLAGTIGITIEDRNTSGLNRSRNQFNQKVPAGNTETHPAGKTQQEATEEAKTEQDFTAYYEDCRATIESPEGQAAMEYLKSRDVFIAALGHGAGYDSKKRRVIIPCSDGFYIARSIDPQEPKRYRNPTGATAAIFNERALYAHEVQEVFITEGTFDALSIMEAEPFAQAIALNSTSNAKILIKNLEQNTTEATLIICLDNDKSGENTTPVLQEGLQRLQIPFITANICNGSKDPNDALLDNRQAFCDAVRDAIADARAYKEKLRKEQERRTGPGMVDAFLETVRTRKYEPVPTGVSDLDNAIGGGFIRQQLVILGSAPGAGKTALAQWIFEGMARQGHTVLFINLEMSREQILARSISRIARQQGEIVRVTEILQGYKWNPQQEAAIIKAAEQYKQEIAPRMIYNPEEVTADLDAILAYMEAEAKKAEAAGNPAPLVCIDYLQIIRGREREEDAATIKRAVSCLKNFAIDHNTVVFLIQAHNRATNEKGTATMGSGRDTSAIEYSADLQFALDYTRCLNRPGEDRKTPDALTPEEKQLVTLKVTKGRFAVPGLEVDLHFNGETMTYTQVYDDSDTVIPFKPGRRYR